MKRPMLEDFCCINGCHRFTKFGYIACRKHVRERRRLLRRKGFSSVAAREVSTTIR